MIADVIPLGRQTLAVRRDALPRLAQAARRLMIAPPADLERLAQAMRSSARPHTAARGASQRAGGAVAVLPLTGILTPRGSLLSYLFGGGLGGLVDFREAFAEAVASPDVGAIVLDVDSPGGLIDLVPETAEDVLAARGSKPIIAVADVQAASGAYWIAAQADELVVTPSGDVGSIGVYMVHEDWSGANEQVGIVPTYIVAEGSPRKVDGNPDEPLSNEARADWQAEVDDLYAMFVDAVAEGRGVSAAEVQANYGQGRTLLAQRAVDAGMADRIATVEEVVGDLLATGARPGTRAQAFALAAQRTAARRAEATSTDPPPADSLSPPAEASDRPAPRAEDNVPAGEPSEPSASAEEQPRCACGRFIEEGETSCDACRDPDATAAAQAPEQDDTNDAEPDQDAETESSSLAALDVAAVLLA